jgi:hypothetical protein
MSQAMDTPGLRQARTALLIFLFLIVYDGALRKWVFHGAEQLVFAVKDMFLGAAFVYLRTTVARTPYRVDPIPGPVYLSLLLYIFWCTVEMFNPGVPNLAVGLWGLKCHVLYAAMIFIVALAFRDLDDFFSSLRKIYPWILIPVIALSLVQLRAPADSVINQQVRGGDEGIAYFGEEHLVRVTGTFSYIAGLASFVQITVLLGFALLLYGRPKPLFLIGLVMSVLALPATGSRSVIVACAAGVALIGLFGYAGGLLRPLQFLAGLVFVGIFIGTSLYFQEATWTALGQRATETQSDEGRVTGVFTDAFDHFDVSGAVGFGTGTANLGAPALVPDTAPFSWLPIGLQFEQESGRIVIELGILGWAISLTFRIAIAIWAFRLALYGATRQIRLAGILGLPITLLGVQVGSGVFAPPLSEATYWMCTGLLALAEREELSLKLRHAATLRAAAKLSAR